MCMKFQIKRHAVISTLISISIAVFLACTVQPASQNSSSESLKVDEVASDSGIKDSVEATVEAFIAETRTAEETMDGEISLPAERYALHDAAWNNSLDVATLLIEQGADIEAKDKNDRTPLHVAAESNSLDVATLLIDLGADIEANNEHGETPLHLAAWGDALEVATLLIDLGADIEAKKQDEDNQPDDTPLHRAVLGEALEVARLLINLGANTEGIDLSWMN